MTYCCISIEEALVQWLAFGHANLESEFESRYPMATFHSLVFPPSGEELPKLLPICPQTGLTMLYAFEAVAAIASLVLNIFTKERKHLRHYYKKSKNLRQITGRRQSILASIKPIGANGL